METALVSHNSIFNEKKNEIRGLLLKNTDEHPKRTSVLVDFVLYAPPFFFKLSLKLKLISETFFRERTLCHVGKLVGRLYSFFFCMDRISQSNAPWERLFILICRNALPSRI